MQTSINPSSPPISPPLDHQGPENILSQDSQRTVSRPEEWLWPLAQAKGASQASCEECAVRCWEGPSQGWYPQTWWVLWPSMQGIVPQWPEIWILTMALTEWTTLNIWWNWRLLLSRPVPPLASPFLSKISYTRLVWRQWSTELQLAFQ